MPAPAIICIGNVARGDDGVGWRVADLLAERLPEQARLVRAPALDVAPVHILGIVLYVVGVVATLWAQLAMGRSWRVGVRNEERTALVTAGPFHWIRNPIYTAMLLAVAGLALMVPTVVSVLAVGALLAALELHVRAVEEPYLTRVHGTAYRDWGRRTGRFLPGIGRLL
jgi:protein-S-isoprenylcysteine O-methyltransferase Ste14